MKRKLLTVPSFSGRVTPATPQRSDTPLGQSIKAMYLAVKEGSNHNSSMMYDKRQVRSWMGRDWYIATKLFDLLQCVSAPAHTGGIGIECPVAGGSPFRFDVLVELADGTQQPLDDALFTQYKRIQERKKTTLDSAVVTYSMIPLGKEMEDGSWAWDQFMKVSLSSFTKGVLASLLNMETDSAFVVGLEDAIAAHAAGPRKTVNDYVQQVANVTAFLSKTNVLAKLSTTFRDQMADSFYEAGCVPRLAPEIKLQELVAMRDNNVVSARDYADGMQEVPRVVLAEKAMLIKQMVGAVVGMQPTKFIPVLRSADDGSAAHYDTPVLRGITQTAIPKADPSEIVFLDPKDRSKVVRMPLFDALRQAEKNPASLPEEVRQQLSCIRTTYSDIGEKDSRRVKGWLPDTLPADSDLLVLLRMLANEERQHPLTKRTANPPLYLSLLQEDRAPEAPEYAFGDAGDRCEQCDKGFGERTYRTVLDTGSSDSDRPMVMKFCSTECLESWDRMG